MTDAADEGQRLLERCLLLPRDRVARGAFADWLQEHDEPELAASIRGERGECLLFATRNLAVRHMRFPSLKFLWGVVLVHIAERDLAQAEYEQMLAERHQEALTWMPTFPPPRRGFFQRLFGG